MTPDRYWEMSREYAALLDASSQEQLEWAFLTGPAPKVAFVVGFGTGTFLAIHIKGWLSRK